ncbi:universal stress protein [Peribacillus cavernae]|nr:universal stress protein [Peribacillus cavernae]MDQ0219945.1 nucleotide-binding universal stress UspA family protein [Peribacillus cavernae]
MLRELSHIIAAFDGSETSKEAIEWGAMFKNSYPDVRLTVVHVYKEKIEQKMIGNPSSRGFANDGIYIDPTQTPPVTAVEQSMIDQNNETHTVIKNSVSMAKSKAFSILNEQQAEGDFEILEGHPAESICSYAARTEADLIIIGSSSKSGLKKFFLGSTSSTVANEAPCPVLIAK